MSKNRLDTCFEQLASEDRGALVAYIMAGDPDLETSLALLKAMPEAGAVSESYDPSVRCQIGDGLLHFRAREVGRPRQLRL